jgi:hypothetical protein
MRIYKTNFSHGSVWVRNFVSEIRGGTQTEGVVSEQDADENIPERDEVTGGWRKKCIMRSFITCTLQLV